MSMISEASQVFNVFAIYSTMCAILQ